MSREQRKQRKNIITKETKRLILVEHKSIPQAEAEIVKKFGCKKIYVARIRHDLRILKKRGYQPGQFPPNKKVSIDDFGPKRETMKALTVGGKTLTEILEERGLDITLERARMILKENWGITSIPKIRKVEWYAERCGHPELANKNFVKKKDRELGLSAFATSLKISFMGLKKIYEKHNLVPQSKK